MNYQPLKGHFDRLPDYHNYYTFLKKVYRHEFRKNGFRRITTPIFEAKDILEKSQSVHQYITNEQMDFDIRQNSNVGVMRAYLDQELFEKIQPFYFYYIDRFFEKIDEGCLERNYIGAEVIGDDDPILEAIMIYMNYQILNKIGLKDTFTIMINSTGIEKEKVKFTEELISFYADKKNVLSDNSKQYLETDPSRILESEDEDDKILNENAPKMVPKFLKKHSKEHFNKFVEFLEILEVPYEIDNTLVASSKTQTKSIWKIVGKEGEVISKGARYNLLAQNIGEKKEIPMCGFQTDADVLIDLLEKNNISLRNKDKIDLFFVQLGDEAKKIVLPISIEAREAGINTTVSLGTPSMKEQMLKAQKSGAKYVVMVGIMEARSGVFQVRNQEDGTQEEVKKEDLIQYIIGKIGKEKLDFYSPEKDLMIGK